MVKTAGFTVQEVATLREEPQPWIWLPLSLLAMLASRLRGYRHQSSFGMLGSKAYVIVGRKAG